MLSIKVAAVVLCSALALSAQNLPAGVALPVMLNSSLSAKNAKQGEKIDGKLMQEVQIGAESHIKQGSHITGHIVSVTRPSASGSRMVVQFDQLQDEHLTIPLHVSVRAIANSQDVFQAGLPINDNSDAESSQEWFTKQVGGDVVNRGRGLVTSDAGKVGIWTGTGVWGKLVNSDDCFGQANGDPQQAMWVFSVTACGVYGFPNIKLDSSAPNGQAVIMSGKNIDIRSGSGWLLITNAAPPSK